MEVEKYLSLDPGNKTGYAIFDVNGDIQRFGTLLSRGHLYEFLKELPESIDVVVVEDYTLYPWKAMNQAWSKLETVRYIGAIDYWARLRGIEITFQPPNVKSIGYMWAGIKVPKNHDLSHETDAYVHGVYYLQKANIRKPQQARND